MMTVRFSSGFAVQYNDATQAAYKDDGKIELQNAKGGWIATAPAGSIVECVQPCRTYNSLHDATNRILEEQAKELRLLKRQIAKLVKK